MIANVRPRPLLAPTLFGVAASAAAAAGLGVGAVSAVTAWRIVRPNRASRPRGWVPRIDPSDVEPVAFAAPGGPQLRGWLMAPPSLGAPMVVCLHGFSMNRHEFEEVVPWLREAGYGCLIFDFRGHGESDGDFTTVAASNEIEDARAAIALVRTRFGSELPLAIYGISMGGAVAIQVTASDAGIRAIVTDCAFATLPRVLDHAFEAWMNLPSAIFRRPVSEFARLFTGIHVDEVRPVDIAHAISPRPYLLIHNTEDRFVDPDDADLIARAYGAGVETWRPGGDHVQSRMNHPEEYRDRVLAFLNSTFK
jgi:pimeloyl-ACP methyl ester carboxylesterase